VAQNPAGLQVSRKSYAATAAAKLALSLAQEQDLVALLYHHNDTAVVLPPGADSWGFGPSGHWGMTLGDHCLTTQAHPEFSTSTGQQVIRQILEYEKDQGPMDAKTITTTCEAAPDFQKALEMLDLPSDCLFVAKAFARLFHLAAEATDS